jgi:hypothetical protein
MFENVIADICTNAEGNFIKSFFNNIKIPMFYYNKLEECNSIIGSIQIENIYNTLSLIENKNKTEKISYFMNTNVKKCIQWCVKNKMEYNIPEENVETNIFKSSLSVKKNIHSFELSEYETNHKDI